MEILERMINNEPTSFRVVDNGNDNDIDNDNDNDDYK